jgi:nucleoside-diphosphate-sugar epimerase
MLAIVTGGAGFIGCNTVKRGLDAGWEVVVIDDHSRRGADKNLAWLQAQGKFAFHKLDIRDASGIDAVFREHRRADAVIHLAHVEKLEKLGGRKIERTYEDWRPGDQQVFVCDVSKAERELGWKRRASINSGIEMLHAWVAQNIDLF